MEEEKKNKNGIIIGVIIFLFVCLIAIIFFMFKMVYVGEKTNDNTNTTDTEETSDEGFTELTKYELQEGEEKEVTIGEKKIKFKKLNNKLYINEIEIEGTYFYVTNQLIITGQGNQYSRETYQMYKFNGEKISFDLGEHIVYVFENLRIEEGKLLAEGLNTDYAIDWISLGKIETKPCEVNDKKLSEYPEIINEYKNKAKEATYSFIYKNEKIEINEEKIIKDLSYIEEKANEICVQESN